MINNRKLDIKPNYPTKKAEGHLSVTLDILYSVGMIGFLLYSFYYSSGNFKNFSLEYLLLLVNGFLSIFGQVLAIRNNTSIHFISFIFCYLFMSVAPLVQIGHNFDPVFKINHIALSAITISLIFTATGVFYTFKTRSRIESKNDHKAENDRYVLLCLLTLLVSVTSLYLFRSGLFTSRREWGIFLATIFPDGPTALIASNFLMSVPFFGATIGLRASITNRQHGWIVLFVAFLTMAMIINNPFINPRFKLAGLIFFFIDYMFKGRKMRLLVFLVMVGVVTAPFFNIFRGKAPSAKSAQIKKVEFGDTFLSYDYDAFQMTCYTILTVNDQGITWGSNIGGALLGFIPRAWWKEKPIPTSHILYRSIIKHRKIGTKNLSTPLVAEGFFAFSWIGAILIGILYWAAVSKIVVLSMKDSKSIYFLIRCVFAGLVLIFLRGTLIVAIPVVIGSLVAALIPWLVFQCKTKSVFYNTVNEVTRTTT